jgi:anti-sigma B factor antagonist/stage II sporulation protein AA (anti-sigma F factor antagonist)
MDISLKEADEAVVLAVGGSMDADNAHELDKAIEARIEAGNLEMVLDLGGLEYISSAGLRVIMKSAKKLEVRQGSIIIVGLRGVVEEVFKVSGFYSLFRTYPSVDEALSAI